MMAGSATDSPPVFRKPPPERKTPPWGGGAKSGGQSEIGGLPRAYYSGSETVASDSYYAPKRIWRERQVMLAAAWICEEHTYLFDYPRPIWRMAAERFGLTAIEAVRAVRLASADRNGGWA